MKRTSEQIAQENDAFRKTLKTNKHHRVIFTRSVLLSPHLETIIAKLRDFKDFNPDNDPYAEHDLAIFDVAGVKYLFKMDYMNSDHRLGVCPYETQEVHRVLSIMEVSER